MKRRLRAALLAATVLIAGVSIAACGPIGQPCGNNSLGPNKPGCINPAPSPQPPPAQPTCVPSPNLTVLPTC